VGPQPAPGGVQAPTADDRGRRHAPGDRLFRSSHRVRARRRARVGVRRPDRAERDRQPRPDYDARRLPRRRRALRDVLRVRRWGRQVRLDRPAAGDPVGRSARRRLDAAAPRPGGAAAGRGPCALHRRALGGRRVGRGPPRDPHRRARHNDPEGRGRGGRQVGARQRVHAPARRARGPRVLRQSQPDLHGGEVRRGRGRASGAGHRRRHADPPQHPDGTRRRRSRPTSSC
jgi:hypothetical protein